MDWTKLKFVAEFRDSNGACDVGDEVERLFGFGSTVVSLGGAGRDTRGTLYVDTRFPTWERAHDYARELYGAACAGADAYRAALRR